MTESGGKDSTAATKQFSHAPGGRGAILPRDCDITNFSTTPVTVYSSKGEIVLAPGDRISDV